MLLVSQQVCVCSTLSHLIVVNTPTRPPTPPQPNIKAAGSWHLMEQHEHKYYRQVKLRLLLHTFFFLCQKPVACVSTTQTPDDAAWQPLLQTCVCVTPVAANVASSRDEELNPSTPPAVFHFQTSGFLAPTDTDSSDVTRGNLPNFAQLLWEPQKALYNIYISSPPRHL